MKVIGYDERGCPIWKEDSWKEIKEVKVKEEPKVKEVKPKPKFKKK